jgi:hypothetical protein
MRPVLWKDGFRWERRPAPNSALRRSSREAENSRAAKSTSVAHSAPDRSIAQSHQSSRRIRPVQDRGFALPRFACPGDCRASAHHMCHPLPSAMPAISPVRAAMVTVPRQTLVQGEPRNPQALPLSELPHRCHWTLEPDVSWCCSLHNPTTAWSASDPIATGDRWSAWCRPTSGRSGCAG